MDTQRFRTLEERTVRFTKNDLIPVEHIPCTNIIELKETAAYTYPGAEDFYVMIECEPTEKQVHCPACHKNALKIHGYLKDRRIVHDVTVGLQQVDLMVEAPRYSCKECGATCTHVFDDIVEGRQFTKRLYEQVKVEVFRGTFSKVAEDFGISDTTAADIFDEYAIELEKKRGVIKAPKVHLAIDEKHVDHVARGIFVDGDTGTLLEMTEDNDQTTVINTIKSMDGWEDIKIITTDMCLSYRGAIEILYGGAIKHVVDKWHVLNILADKIATCRTAIIEYLNEQIEKDPDEQRKAEKRAVKKLVTDDGYLFKYGEQTLSEKKTLQKILATVCRTFPEFNHLRLLKEGFELIYTCSDRAAAEGVFKEWCKLVPPKGKKQIEAWEKEYGVKAELFAKMRSLKNTVQTIWNREIFNYFDDDSFRTNAIAEATNSFVERMVINSYGFKRLRAKALFWHIAGPRTRYVLSHTSKPKYKTDYTTRFKTGSDFHLWTEQILIGYEDIYEIQEVPEAKVYPQLSVLMYLPSNTPSSKNSK